MDVVSSGNWKISGEIVPMVVLITDNMEEGSLGMMTTLSHHDQAKVESSEVLSNLHLRDSPELNMMVVRISPTLLTSLRDLLAFLTWM